ncbi:ATP-dependent helicase [Marmoricola sp. RAF53]|uniref:ATP-dependent helicase n=1 Tax=Marmoricola sp. RAF53 TaxID=3233059 RepID=UPI003F9CD084
MTTHHLVRPAGTVAAPTLDEDQRRVVEHVGGPLLVLAGPGTGKTTTLVEAIVSRIEDRGAAPDSVLALTFGRKAADQLRDRVTARLGRTTSTTVCATFHSFAYGLLRRFAPAELYAAPLRLLSAPEQDGILRELLVGTPESVAWPDSLKHALGTRGFAKEVHAVLGRAREKGLDPEELRGLGAAHDLPELVAAGLFLEQYLTVLDSQGATDYADLIRRATIEAAAHRDELRAEFRHVFVDEYQDTDPGQVALLRQLAGDGRDLVAVGDPHQSIYAFRGADVRGILDFPAAFPQRDGSPADTVVLRRTRRFGPRILAGAQRVAGQLAWQGSIDEAAREAFRVPECVPGPHGDGRIEVLTFDTERAEAEHLADLLRRAHLEDGVAWHDMAVLVRSGRSTIPGLRRSLAAAGVPVEIAADEVPLVRDPAVQPLLDALRAVLNLDNHDPDHVDFVDAGRAEGLLLGPLAGLDAGDVRRLGRALRQREKARVLGPDDRHRPSRDLLRLAVLQDGFLDGLPGPEADRARAFNALLVAARRSADDGDSAAEVLWVLWSGTGWPERLRRATGSGGAAAGRAHRDLDSLCALFESAARAEEQRDHLGVRPFLDTLVAQEIPGDTLAERGVRGSAVRLLTAHRSKGLEWRLVVVAHVQQGGWPDLRRRSTLLGADRIGTDGLVPPVSTRELLAEERRLFYVACTRARQRLVVTAVRSPEDDGEQPSRFLDELGLEPVAVTGRPRRPLSLAGVVAELRRTVADPAASEALRDAAAWRLARLAGETVGTPGHERPLVPQADPGSWWGTRAATWSPTPVRDPGEPVPISASLLESVLVCPTQWFLTREAGGVVAAHQAANVGQLVHALAERVAKGELADADVDALMGEVDKVWDRLEFRTPWSRSREYGRIRAALGRFLAWHRGNRRDLVGIESRFTAVVDLPGGERVKLVGYADRLELDADGRLVVVDLKTGRTPPTGPEVQRNVQLALYQYAVDSGAADHVGPPDAGPHRSGGAELVQLGLLDDAPTAVVQEQAVPAEDGAERAALRAALEGTAAMLRTETFPAIAGQQCERCDFVSICPIKSAGAVLA